MARIFRHEGDDARALHRIPLCVRRKALESGVATNEDAWQALPLAARQRLVAMHVDSPMERRVFGVLVGWLERTFPVEACAGRALPAKPSPCVDSSWRREIPPEPLRRPLKRMKVDWSQLDADARFALVVAADEGPNRLSEALRAVCEETRLTKEARKA